MRPAGCERGEPRTSVWGWWRSTVAKCCAATGATFSNRFIRSAATRWLARRWTVDDLAQQAGTSRTVLAERFKALMGQTPIEYITGWRMQLAAERLRAGHDSLAAIAADVGYESEAAFNRAFKRVTGVTPGRWRDAETT